MDICSKNKSSRKHRRIGNSWLLSITTRQKHYKSCFENPILALDVHLVFDPNSMAFYVQQTGNRFFPGLYCYRFVLTLSVQAG